MATRSRRTPKGLAEAAAELPVESLPHEGLELAGPAERLFCPKCGDRIASGEHPCDRCGAALKDASAKRLTSGERRRRREQEQRDRRERRQARREPAKSLAAPVRAARDASWRVPLGFVVAAATLAALLSMFGR